MGGFQSVVLLLGFFFYLSVFWRILGNFVLFRLIIPLVKYLIFLELFSFFFLA